MAGFKIENMHVKNTARGKAFLMARFDVNLGPMTIKGFELVRVGDTTFVSEPYNLYTPQGESKPKRFTYVFFNGEKGTAVKEKIVAMVKEEYARRSSAPQQPRYENNPGYGASAPPPYQPPAQAPQAPDAWLNNDDDGLPFS